MTKHVTLISFLVLLVPTILGCASTATSAENEQAVKNEPSQKQAAVKKTPAPSRNQPKKASPAKDKFAVKLETTKGDIIIDLQREWAPNGVDRFSELVKAGFFNDVAFFRVIRGFMVQTGISGDPALNAIWRKKRIPDDPASQSNTKGMVSFATSGPNSRTTQFFINFSDNKRLDKMGFTPIGKVRDMAVVETLYAEYGEGAPRGRGPSQGRIQREGNPYLKKEFPKLDYLKTATIIEE